MKILVTGCAGFIGSHVVESLLKQGHQITGIDNFNSYYLPAIKRDNLKEALQDSNFQLIVHDIQDDWSKIPSCDMVIHLAAEVGVRDSLIRVDDYRNTNIQGTQNLLDWMKHNHVGKIVYASTSSVYGQIENQKASTELDELYPKNPYAQSKLAAEKMVQNYCITNKRDGFSLRLFTVYGERQRPDLAFQKFKSAFQAGKSISIYGDGESTRDYTHVKDVVSAISQSVKYLLDSRGPIYQVLNIGSGSSITINEVLKIFKQKLGEFESLQYLDTNSHEMQHTRANIRLAQEIISYQPRVNILEGLAQFLKK